MVKTKTAAHSYDGDMTITISPGLDIRIPNHQLVSPDYHFNAEGSLTEPNSTVRELLFNSLQEANANDMPVLGRPFLASSYLFVDNDRQEFTLWPGNPTATEEEIIPVGTTTTCIPNIGTATPPAASPTPGSKDLPPISPSVTAPLPASSSGVSLG